MTFGERIKKVRKALDLTQQEFADRIGSKRNTVATYEMGRTEPSAAVASLICREFNVSEEWLRTGIGEMFTQREPQPLEDLLTQLIRGRDITGADRILVKNFLELPENSRQEVITFISKCAQEIADADQDELSSAVQAWAPVEIGGQEQTDDDIERQVEDYRRRLVLEKKQAGTPSPSSADDVTA